MRRFSKFRTFLAWALGLTFALQVAVALPAHNAHTAHQHEWLHAESHSPAPDSGESDDGHCRFFLAFCALDSASAAPPPAFALHEARYSFLTLAITAKTVRPNYATPARGPPTRS